MNDLAKLTPPEMDERFVAVWMKKGRARATLDYLSNVERLGPYQEAEQVRAERSLAEALAEEDLLGTEFSRRGGWSRYWLVVNHDGHVHRATNCSTTFVTTRWALVTSLSGLTEDEMVEQVGHQACTVCFPQAPVHPAFVRSAAEAEAAETAKREALCEGSGTSAQGGSRMRYTTCHVCGRRGVSVTQRGMLRAHKSPEAERAEAKAAADADPKKILSPDGSPLHSRYGEVKTVVSAWRELVSDLDFVRSTSPDNHYRSEYQESVDRVAAALAAKLGTSVEEIMRQADEKLAAKRKREGR